MSHEKGNSLTKDGADRLAQTIEAYWVSRGLEPRVFLTTSEITEHGRHCAIYMVRSNMVNGMPHPRPERGA